MKVRLMRGRLVALLLGLGFVALIELGLRLMPTLEPPPFTLQLAKVEDQLLTAINPAYARRFFSGVAADVPLSGIRMTPRPFVEPRAPNALRVLFAGGSTVQGYPHPKRLSAPSYLQEMLGDLYPDHQVEVFNAGITAASSFVVARAVEDGIEALAPDLVVVYTGHNEFYGVYGVASLAQGGRQLWIKRIHYEVMQWRMTRLIGRLLAQFRASSGPPTPLIEVMARTGMVRVDDPNRARAVASLEENLRDIAVLCREEEIPLVLSTLTSNERGFAPARIDPPLPEPVRVQYLDLVARSGRSQVAATALEELEKARGLWADDAYLHYLRGYHMEKLGDGTAAREAYLKARELDQRPWRSVAAFNQVVRRVAAEEEGVLLADVEGAFVDASPAAGVGWELMADHLHPTSTGQLLLARTLVAALDGEPYWEAPRGQIRTDEEYRFRLGDLPVEQLSVIQAMAALFGAPPMDQGNEIRARELVDQIGGLWDQLSVGEQQGVNRWREGRGTDILTLNVAEALFESGDYSRARSYYEATYLEKPYTIWGDLWSILRSIRCRQLMGYALEAADRDALSQMLHRLSFLGQASGFSPGLQAFIKGYALHFLGERREALVALEEAVEDGTIRQRFFTDLLELLVAELMMADRYADAERYARQISEEQGQYEFGRILVERIKADQNLR